ncbi:hypothetical protein VCV18_004669 [Metarhizium anisopliae]
MEMAGTATRAIEASPRVYELLKRLHTASATQEKSLSQVLLYLKTMIGFYIRKASWPKAADHHMRHKFVSLEQDKCQFMYLLARSLGAKNIIEVGTSIGVSTIYLALAVGQNVRDARVMGMRATGNVVATKKEATKAAEAIDYWIQAGDEVES